MLDGVYRIELEPREAGSRIGVAIISKGKIEGILGGELCVGNYLAKGEKLIGQLYASNHHRKNGRYNIIVIEHDGGFSLKGEADGDMHANIALLGTWIAEWG